jgi:hypothetical protein
MVGWISHIHDNEFIGYGPNIECSHCHNKVWLEVWQPYFHQKLYSVIPAHPKMYRDFNVRCRVCLWGFKIKKRDKEKMGEILEQGRTATKYSFDKMEAKARERLLRNLNRNGFTQLAQFLSFSDQIV